MNNLFTGYFAQIKKYINRDLVGVSICGKPPIFYKGLEYKTLAPKYSFFIKYKNGEIGENEYTSEYYKLVLNNLDPKKVLEELDELTQHARYVVLLCYEKPDDFCHRHIVSKWLTENTDLNVEEVKL